MGSAIATEPVETPDTFGLPEYYVTDTFIERDGPNIRIICGVRRNGVVHWLYSAVMRKDNLAVANAESRMAVADTH